MAPPRKTFDEQFWPKVEADPNSGCWLWSGALNKGGYSVIQFQRRTLNAHRVAYEQLVCEVPSSLDLDHKCRTRCCVNPAHLEPVTPKENIARSPIHPGAVTHCPQGHEYSHANTARTRGERRCKTCAAERARARRATPEYQAWREQYLQRKAPRADHP